MGLPVDMSVVFRTMQSLPNEPLPQCLHDLPGYPFNHTRRYWRTSRIAGGPENKTGRPWNVLLGRRVDHTPSPTSKCRNIFKLEDIPWLRDHVISGTTVFPLAGYLCAAVEALEMLRDERSAVIHGFELLKVSVSKAFALDVADRLL